MNAVRLVPEVADEVGLSERHQTVLSGLVAGDTDAVIARRVGLAEDAVRRAVVSMLRLLEARDRAHLVAAAFVRGVLTTAPEVSAEGAGRIPRWLTEPYLMACACGRGLAPNGMRRLVPPRPTALAALTVQPIVCPTCAREAS